MIGNTPLTEARGATEAQEGGIRPDDSFKIGFCLDPMKVSISRMSDTDFDAMSREELIEVVKICGIDQMSHDGSDHISFIDDHELRRLACLARIVCQRQVHSQYVQQGSSSPFTGRCWLM